MIKKLLFTLNLLFLFQLQAQNCCSNAQGMAAFANDSEFLLAHANPLPYTKSLDPGIVAYTFACSDGKEGRAVKKEGTTKRFLILFHEWWGLNEYIKEQVGYWHKKMGGKVSVIAIDMYDGKTATDREAASALMENLSTARSQVLIEGLLATLPDDGMVATLGWCMGGGLSLQAGITGGSKIKACVLYYGMPEMDPEKLRKLRAPVYAIFAQRDQWVNQKVIDDFYKAMGKANREYRYDSFDADHAFANPSNPNYDQKKAQEAEAKISAFIKKQFGGIL